MRRTQQLLISNLKPCLLSLNVQTNRATRILKSSIKKKSFTPTATCRTPLFAPAAVTSSVWPYAASERFTPARAKSAPKKSFPRFLKARLTKSCAKTAFGKILARLLHLRSGRDLLVVCRKTLFLLPPGSHFYQTLLRRL